MLFSLKGGKRLPLGVAKGGLFALERGGQNYNISIFQKKFGGKAPPFMNKGGA